LKAKNSRLCLFFFLSAYSLFAFQNEKTEPIRAYRPQSNALEPAYSSEALSQSPFMEEFEMVHQDEIQGHEAPIVYSRPFQQVSIPQDFLDSWLARPNTLAAIYNNSKPYLADFYLISRRNTVPLELIFLPAAESGFKNASISSSGAVGIWQFMQGSAEPYGIRIDEYLDERYDVNKSADAAFRKLQFNKNRLNDWLLALAAYNCGLRCIQDLILESGLENPSYWDLQAAGMKTETMNYVPKFLALSTLLSHPGRHGVPLNWEPNAEIRVSEIRVPYALSLELIARGSGITVNRLKALNPSIRGNTTPTYPYLLKVPQNSTDIVKGVIQQNIAAWTIRQGDTAYSISLLGNLNLKVLEQLNPGINLSRLQVGDILLVPAELIQFREEVQDELKGIEFERYVIQPGDTFWGLSRRYGISMEALGRKNGILSPYSISVGQTILVPVSVDENP
jgi:membrane-bound lytic murein transglycosylase D